MSPGWLPKLESGLTASDGVQVVCMDVGKKLKVRESAARSSEPTEMVMYAQNNVSCGKGACWLKSASLLFLVEPVEPLPRELGLSFQ